MLSNSKQELHNCNIPTNCSINNKLYISNKTTSKYYVIIITVQTYNNDNSMQPIT